MWQIFEAFIWSPSASLLDLRCGGFSDHLGCMQNMYRVLAVWLDLFSTVSRETIYILICVLFLRSLSHLMTKHSLTQLSSARLISIWSHLVTEELVLSGCYSLFFPTALLNHFIFITCLAGAHPLTFDSLRPTWDRDEIDCQECGRGGKEECNAG